MENYLFVADAFATCYAKWKSVFQKNDLKSSENLLILTVLRVTEISVIVNLHNVCVAKVLKSS